MLAALVLLYDAMMGSVAGKLGAVVTGAVAPVLLFGRKEQLRHDQELGLNPDQDTLLLIQKSKQMGANVTSGQDLLPFDLDSTDVPSTVQWLVGEWVLTAGERIELAQFIFLQKLLSGEGAIGRELAGFSYERIIEPRDVPYLEAKIRLLKEYYYPVRLMDPEIRAMVEEYRRQKALRAA